MDQTGNSTSTFRAAIDAALAEPAIASLLANGGPVIVASTTPPSIVFANPAAETFFGATGAPALTARLFGSAEQGSRRLVELAATLRPGAPPRLEKLRFAIGRRVETLTCLCRRVDGASPLLIVGAMGVRVAAPPVAPTPFRPVEPAAPPAAGHVSHLSPPEDVEPVSNADPDEPIPAVEPPHAASSVAPESLPLAHSVEDLAPEQVEKPATVAPVLRTFEDTRDDLLARFNKSSTVRFLWKSDATGRLAEITGHLCEVVGCDTPALIGQNFAEHAHDVGADPDRRLADKLSRKETWSGLELPWPITGSHAAAPITLGALPSFDRAREFDGFRGFGVIHLRRLAPYAPPEPKVATPVESVAHEDAEPVAHATETSRDVVEDVETIAPLHLEHVEASTPPHVEPSTSTTHEPVVAAPSEHEKHAPPPANVDHRDASSGDAPLDRHHDPVVSALSVEHAAPDTHATVEAPTQSENSAPAHAEARSPTIEHAPALESGDKIKSSPVAPRDGAVVAATEQTEELPALSGEVVHHDVTSSEPPREHHQEPISTVAEGDHAVAETHAAIEAPEASAKHGEHKAPSAIIETVHPTPPLDVARDDTADEDEPVDDEDETTSLDHEANAPAVTLVAEPAVETPKPPEPEIAPSARPIPQAPTPEQIAAAIENLHNHQGDNVVPMWSYRAPITPTPRFQPFNEPSLTQSTPPTADNDAAPRPTAPAPASTPVTGDARTTMVELSAAERKAFSDIAKALGAKPVDEDERTRKILAAETNEDATDAKPDAPNQTPNEIEPHLREVLAIEEYARGPAAPTEGAPPNIVKAPQVEAVEIHAPHVETIEPPRDEAIDETAAQEETTSIADDEYDLLDREAGVPAASTPVERPPDLLDLASAPEAPAEPKHDVPHAATHEPAEDADVFEATEIAALAATTAVVAHVAHDDQPLAHPPENAPVAAAPEPRDEIAHNAAAVLERLPVGVLVSRLEAPIYLNRALLDMLGFASADVFHEAGGLDRLFHGRQPEDLTAAANGGTIPVIAASGDVISVEGRMQTIEWDGAPATLMSFRKPSDPDLLPHVRSLEAELRQAESSNRELHAILDTATDGVATLDQNGRILSLNRSAEALFGYEQNEVAGESFTILLAPESHSAATEYLAGLRANGVASLLNDGRDAMGRARQGGSIPIFMTLGRLGATGQKFCAVMRDMTQWKKVERELRDARREAERASQLKSDFLAKISHEIRTPLNAILGFAEVIMDERFGPVGNQRYKDYLKDIHASGGHVMSLVNDLLDLSKIEAGKLDLNFGAVDANKIVAECVSLIQPQATTDRVIVRSALASRLPKIVADERSLRQIVLNLLSNAVKFNEPGGQVIVSTALTDAGHAVLRIKDTGVGMSEAEVQTALEPFRQIQTSRAHGGTGLGLPLTKALVEANRASFTIRSKKNEGTLVEVSFPSTRVLAE
jgi:PAS domain S-box-containing protein